MASKPYVTEGNVVDGDDRNKTTSDAIPGIPLYENADLGPECNNKFRVNGYRDVWAIPVFVVVMAATAIAGIVQRAGTEQEGETYHVSEKAKRYLPFAALASVGFALVSLAIMRAHPVGYIYFAIITSVLLMLISAISLLAAGAIVLGVFTLAGACLAAFVFYMIRDRIPFAALLLKTSVTLVTRYWGSIITGLVSLLCICVFYALWALAVVPVMGSLENSEGKNAGSMFLSFLLIFILFWAAQVGANVVHVTASGIVATWYFAGEAHVPASPTMANLKRALTTSFGSICFGSAIVALLKTIYYFLRRAIDSIDHPVVECILGCILGMIERLTELFNIYAFTYVAIYGSDFITAAKETFALAKNCGWAVVFNDSLVWPVLSITNLFGSMFIAVIFGLVSGSAGVATMAFLLAAAVFTIFFRPVYSGVATQFVCVAENPNVMQVTNPAYAEEMYATVPPDVRSNNNAGDTNRVTSTAHHLA